MANRIYQNGFNASASHSQVSMDRARGGIITITLTIPEKTHRVRTRVGTGFVTIPAVSVTLDIDLEQMPLVNVAGYKTDRTQTGPDEMPYPNGVVKYNENFG